MVHYYALLDDLVALNSLRYAPPPLLSPGLDLVSSFLLLLPTLFSLSLLSVYLGLPGSTRPARLPHIALPGFCISHRVI